MNIVRVLAFAFFAVYLSGCAAIDTAIEFKDLKLFSYSGDPIILETKPRTAYVDVKAPVELAGLKQAIESKIRGKGIELVDSDASADLAIFVVLGDANLEETSAKRVSQYGTGSTAAGGMVGGAGVGALSRGSLSGAVAGATIGLVGGSVADLTVNNWVKLGDLRVKADILVKERVPESVKTKVESTTKSGAGTTTSQERLEKNDNYLRHQTSVQVRAQKTNLKWEDCAEPMRQKLAQEITMFI
jgi:hypothetical protein